MSKLKSSLFVIGNLLVFFSIYSFIPGIIDYYNNGTDWVVFFVISIICLFTGLNVSFVFKKRIMMSMFCPLFYLHLYHGYYSHL